MEEWSSEEELKDAMDEPVEEEDAEVQEEQDGSVEELVALKEMRGMDLNEGDVVELEEGRNQLQ